MALMSDEPRKRSVCEVGVYIENLYVQSCSLMRQQTLSIVLNCSSFMSSCGDGRHCTTTIWRQLQKSASTAYSECLHHQSSSGVFMGMSWPHGIPLC